MKKLLAFFLLLSVFVKAQTTRDSVLHTFIIIGENTSYSQTIPAAPYITSLTAKGTSFTNYNAITHPSQPNYYALWAASTLGITNDADPIARSKSQLNIYTQLNSVGKTTEGYFEGLPSQGSYVFSQGRYYAKHNGFYAFNNIPATVMKTFGQIPSNLNSTANVVWVVPDILNDGHDTGVLFFDNYLKTNSQMQAIINYCLNPVNKSRCIITFDEGSSSSNKIVCILLGYGVKVGTVSTSYNHYNLFNTLIKPYGGGTVNNSVGLPAMTGWEQTIVIPPPPDTTKCYKTVKDSTKSIVRIDTTFKWNVTSTTVEIPCPQDTSGHYFVLGFYEQFYNQTAVDKVKLDALIRDVNSKKITDLHCYDVRGLTQAQMTAMNNRIRNECPTIRHIIDVTTNGMPHDGFDGVNNESEPWWQGVTPDQEWTASKSQFTPIVNAMKSQGKQVFWHFGWWNTPLMASQCPKYLADNMTAVMLHYYRASMTDFGYTKGRLDNIEATATGVVDYIVYPSYEAIYGQNWPGTIEDWYKQYEVWFKAQNYKHIRLVGIIGFTRQLYNVKHPVPPANVVQAVMNVFRKAENRNPQYEGFDKTKQISTE